MQWLLIRNNSSFIVKGAHNHTFTTVSFLLAIYYLINFQLISSSFLTKLKEPNNLKGKNSFRFNGLVHNKTVGVSATSDKKGVVLSTRNQSGKLILKIFIFFCVITKNI